MHINFIPLYRLLLLIRHPESTLILFFKQIKSLALITLETDQKACCWTYQIQIKTKFESTAQKINFFCSDLFIKCEHTRR